MQDAQPAVTDAELVRATIDPGTPAAGSGAEISDYDSPVEYEAYPREGVRHGWTLAPDRAGRFHSLTLQWKEDERAWVITAAPAFDSLEQARDWAERLDRETEGTA